MKKLTVPETPEDQALTVMGRYGSQRDETGRLIEGEPGSIEYTARSNGSVSVLTIGNVSREQAPDVISALSVFLGKDCSGIVVASDAVRLFGEDADRIAGVLTGNDIPYRGANTVQFPALDYGRTTKFARPGWDR